MIRYYFIAYCNIFDYLYTYSKKEDLNLAILNTFKDGYKQSEIANYIQMSNSLISKIVKSDDSSPDP